MKLNLCYAMEIEKTKSLATAHKNEVQMQNCNRLNRLGLVREKRPGTAYDVSGLEFENNDVLSSTISLFL